MDTKECKKCNTIKSVSEFYPNASGGSGGYDAYCKICRYAYHRSRKDIINKQRSEKMKVDALHREKVLSQKRASHKNNLERALLSRAKARAIKWGLLFDITIEDIIIPEKCPLLSIDIIPGSRGNYMNTPSLDRIDNDLGYVKGNIAVISMLANSMKNAASIELLNTFVANLPKYLNKIKR
jgi:hypothetical protein